MPSLGGTNPSTQERKGAKSHQDADGGGHDAVDLHYRVLSLLHPGDNIRANGTSQKRTHPGMPPDSGGIRRGCPPFGGAICPDVIYRVVSALDVFPRPGALDGRRFVTETVFVAPERGNGIRRTFNPNIQSLIPTPSALQGCRGRLFYVFAPGKGLGIKRTFSQKTQTLMP